MTIPSPAVQYQGQAVISADNANTWVQVVLGITQLRGFTGLNNMLVLLLGENVINDGLGGPFYYNVAATALDDGNTVIRPTGATVGAWLRLGYFLQSTGSNLLPVGTANMNTGQVLVATSATLILAARPGLPGTGRASVTFLNGGSAPIYLGTSSAVTIANGIELLAGASISLTTTTAIYGISASGSATVSFAEFY